MNEAVSTPNLQIPTPKYPGRCWELGLEVGDSRFYVLTKRPREMCAAIASTSAGIVETVGCTATGMPN
jgi:hypothetical protein